MSTHIEMFSSLGYQGDTVKQVQRMLQKNFVDIPLALVHSYGCQQNSSDTERLKGMLAEMGFGFTDTIENASLVLFNTCAVRENAEVRVFGNVGELKQWKKKNPNLLICLCGCMMQQEHVVEKIKKSYPYVDIVFGTHNASLFPSFVWERLQNQRHIFDISCRQDTIPEGMPILRDSSFKAWVPIMNGCDNFCTYCVVPFVRGRERSRNPESILREVRELVESGYREINLLGQNVNSYGKGLDTNIRFSQLLQQIDQIPGEFQIRFMTSHPKDCTKELIDTIASSRKICHHIHLPVQSGSDRILTLMNRHYTASSYLDLIQYAREVIPDITFSSDIIVGFPGETYEDFRQTLKLVEAVKYISLFTFLYSKRRGTRAEKMPDMVPKEEKAKWFQELLELQSAIGAENNKKWIGKTVKVLADSFSKKGEPYLCGKTPHNLIVEFPGEHTQIGQFVYVTITSAANWAVSGQIADTQTI